MFLSFLRYGEIYFKLTFSDKWIILPQKINKSVTTKTAKLLLTNPKVCKSHGGQFSAHRSAREIPPKNHHCSATTCNGTTILK